MKLVFFNSVIVIIIWIIAKDQSSVQAETLKCDFATASWQFAVTLYYCAVGNNDIFKANTQITITGIIGRHISKRQNADLAGISFDTLPNVSRLPKSLNHFFPNLISIQIYNSSLTEIHQSDLKVFPKLKYLYLCCNKLEVIENDLFKFNPDLKLIWLHNNRIWHIHPFVFTFLHKLEVLWLDGNQCSKSFGDVNNKGEVEEIVKRIEDEGCSSYRYTSNQTYEKIENESKKLQEKFENFSIILTKLLDENRSLRLKVDEIAEKVNKN